MADNSEIARLKIAVDTSDLATAQAQYEQFQQSINSSNTAIGSQSQKSREASGDIDKMSQSIKQSGTALADQATKSAAVSTATQKLVSDMKAVSGEANAAKTAFGSIAQSMQGGAWDKLTSVFGSVRSSIAGLLSPTKEATAALTEHAASHEAAALAAERFRESAHALHPILGTLGIKVGELTSLSRLAHAGMTILGTVIGGLFIVEVEKAADKVELLRRKITALGGEDLAKQFDKVSESVEESGGSAEVAAGAFEKVRTSMEKSLALKGIHFAPGAGPAGLQAVGDATVALQKELELAGDTAGAAEKEVTKFFEDTGKTGTLTKDVFDKLPESLQTFLAKLQGRDVAHFSAQLDKIPLSLGSIVPALARQKEGLTRELAAMPETVDQAKDKMLKAWDAMIGGIASTHIPQNILGGLTNALKGLGKDTEGVGASIRGVIDPIGAAFSGLTEAAGGAENAVKGIGVALSLMKWGLPGGLISGILLFKTDLEGIAEKAGASKEAIAGMEAAAGLALVTFGLFNKFSFGPIVAGLLLVLQHWDDITSAVRKAIDAVEKFSSTKVKVSDREDSPLGGVPTSITSPLVRGPLLSAAWQGEAEQKSMEGAVGEGAKVPPPSSNTSSLYDTLKSALSSIFGPTKGPPEGLGLAPGKELWSPENFKKLFGMEAHAEEAPIAPASQASKSPEDQSNALDKLNRSTDIFVHTLEQTQSETDKLNRANLDSKTTLEDITGTATKSKANLDALGQSVDKAGTATTPLENSLKGIGDASSSASAPVSTLQGSVESLAQSSTAAAGTISAAAATISAAASTASASPAAPSTTPSSDQTTPPPTDIGKQQAGGIYTVGGTGGVDSVPLTGMFSPGEQLVVSPPGSDVTNTGDKKSGTSNDAIYPVGSDDFWLKMIGGASYALAKTFAGLSKDVAVGNINHQVEASLKTAPLPLASPQLPPAEAPPYVPQPTAPSFQQAVQHQQQWGMPNASTQIADIVGRTASVAINTVLSPIKIAKGLTEQALQGEDVAADPEAIKRSTDLAMSLAGGGMMGAEKGAFGIFGGRGSRLPSEAIVNEEGVGVYPGGQMTVPAYKGAHPYVNEPDRDWKGNVIKSYGEPKELMKDEPFSSSAGHAGFFSSDPSVASRFASVLSRQPAVFPVDLNFKNPFEMEGKGAPAAAWQFESVAREHGMLAEMKAVSSALKDMKHDGVIVRNTKDEGDVFIPKKGSQVTSQFARDLEQEKPSVVEAPAAETGVKPSQEIAYHGTRQPWETGRKTPVYTTSDPQEASAFAGGVHLGGVGNEPQIHKFGMKAGSTRNIDDILMDAMDEGEDVGQTVENEIAKELNKQTSTGARYLQFSHPSSLPGKDDFDASVSLYPHEDLSLLSTQHLRASPDKPSVVEAPAAEALSNTLSHIEQSNVTKASLKTPLAKSEEDAIGNYTQGSYEKVGGYRNINQSLRNDSVDAVTKAEIDKLDSAFSKVSLSRDLDTFRHVDDATHKSLAKNVGGDVIDPGFVSTALEDEGTANTVAMKIPKGSKALPISNLSTHPGEGEVLVDRGSKFHVSMQEGKIHLDLLDPSQQEKPSVVEAPAAETVSKPSEGVTAYHGTTAAYEGMPSIPPEGYMMDRMLGPHFAADPEVSNSFVMHRRSDVDQGPKEGGRMFQATLPKDEDFLPVTQPQNSVDQFEIERMIMKEAFTKDPSILERYLHQARNVPADQATGMATRMAGGEELDLPTEGKSMDMDRFLKNFGGKPYNAPDRQRAVDLARESWQEQGYKGLKYTNTSPMEMEKASDPTSYVLFDPKDAKSKIGAGASEAPAAAVETSQLSPWIKDNMDRSGLVGPLSTTGEHSWRNELGSMGADLSSVDQMEKLFDQHRWGGEGQVAADRNIHEAFHSDTDLGKSLKLQSHLEESIRKHYEQTKDARITNQEQASQKDMEDAWEHKWGPYNPDAYGDWKEQWNTEHKYEFDKAREPTRYYRAGGADKDVLATSLNERGAQSYAAAGSSSQPHYVPDHSWTADQLHDQGYQVLGGFGKATGYQGESEVTWIKALEKSGLAKQKKPSVVEAPAAEAPPSEQAAMAAPAKPPIIAYHGSPHDWDKPDLSKVGTGGGQTYGYGFYAAENEQVAQKYQGVNRQDPGKMYQLAINADPEHFLDLDKTLGKQSEHVQSALSRIHGFGPDDHSEDVAGSFFKPGTAEESKRYAEGGIPGSKYLDQGSRSAGEGTRNYVMFDDKMIDVIKKYGLMGAGAGLGTAAIGAKETQAAGAETAEGSTLARSDTAPFWRNLMGLFGTGATAPHISGVDTTPFWQSMLGVVDQSKPVIGGAGSASVGAAPPSTAAHPQDTTAAATDKLYAPAKTDTSTAATDKLSESTDKAATQTETLTQGLDKIDTSLSQADTKTTMFDASLSKVGTSVDIAQSSFTQVGDAVSSMAQAATQAASTISAAADTVTAAAASAASSAGSGSSGGGGGGSSNPYGDQTGIQANVGGNQYGGMYVIGGSGPPDSVQLSGKVSPGETVAVLPPEAATPELMRDIQNALGGKQAYMTTSSGKVPASMAAATTVKAESGAMVHGTCSECAASAVHAQTGTIAHSASGGALSLSVSPGETVAVLPAGSGAGGLTSRIQAAIGQSPIQIGFPTSTAQQLAKETTQPLTQDISHVNYLPGTNIPTGTVLSYADVLAHNRSIPPPTTTGLGQAAPWKSAYPTLGGVKLPTKDDCNDPMFGGLLASIDPSLCPDKVRGGDQSFQAPAAPVSRAATQAAKTASSDAGLPPGMTSATAAEMAKLFPPPPRTVYAPGEGPPSLAGLTAEGTPTTDTGAPVDARTPVDSTGTSVDSGGGFWSGVGDALSNVMNWLGSTVAQDTSVTPISPDMFAPPPDTSTPSIDQSLQDTSTPSFDQSLQDMSTPLDISNSFDTPTPDMSSPPDISLSGQQSGGIYSVANTGGGADSLSLQTMVSPGETVAFIPQHAATSDLMSTLQAAIGKSPVTISSDASGSVTPPARSSAPSTSNTSTYGPALPNVPDTVDQSIGFVPGTSGIPSWLKSPIGTIDTPIGPISAPGYVDTTSGVLYDPYYLLSNVDMNQPMPDWLSLPPGIVNTPAGLASKPGYIDTTSGVLYDPSFQLFGQNTGVSIPGYVSPGTAAGREASAASGFESLSSAIFARQVGAAQALMRAEATAPQPSGGGGGASVKDPNNPKQGGQAQQIAYKFPTPGQFQSQTPSTDAGLPQGASPTGTAPAASSTAPPNLYPPAGGFDPTNPFFSPGGMSNIPPTYGGPFDPSNQYFNPGDPYLQNYGSPSGSIDIGSAPPPDWTSTPTTSPWPDTSTPSTDTSGGSSDSSGGSSDSGGGGGDFSNSQTGNIFKIPNTGGHADSVSLRGMVSPGETVAIIPAHAATSELMSTLQDAIGKSPITLGSGASSTSAPSIKSIPNSQDGNIIKASGGPAPSQSSRESLLNQLQNTIQGSPIGVGSSSGYQLSSLYDLMMQPTQTSGLSGLTTPQPSASSGSQGSAQEWQNYFDCQTSGALVCPSQPSGSIPAGVNPFVGQDTSCGGGGVNSFSLWGEPTCGPVSTPSTTGNPVAPIAPSSSCGGGGVNSFSLWGDLTCSPVATPSTPSTNPVAPLGPSANYFGGVSPGPGFGNPNNVPSYALGPAPAYSPYGSGGGGGGGVVWGSGVFQEGGEFQVPPDVNRARTILDLHAGEHVDITPAAKGSIGKDSNGQGNGEYHLHVHGVSDPNQFASVSRSAMVRRAANSFFGR